MPAMIGKRRGHYRSQFHAGDEFNATRGDAKILVAVGHAEYHKPKQVDAVERQEPVATIKPRQRTYKRRDMVAEQTPVNVRIISDDEAA